MQAGPEAGGPPSAILLQASGHSSGVDLGSGCCVLKKIAGFRPGRWVSG